MYKACDMYGDGLDHDDFRTAACYEKWSVTGLSITEFLRNVDTDGDGRVLFREMVEHLIPWIDGTTTLRPYLANHQIQEILINYIACNLKE